MCKNEIVEDFKKTLTQSFFKSGRICGIDECIIHDAYNQVRDKIDKGTLIIDSACDEFAKYVLDYTSNELKEEKVPEGLELIFSGKNGGKLYIQLASTSELVTNDPSLLTNDLNSLKKSFYPEDYLEADKIHKMILSRGVITLNQYLEK